jgi:thiol-disulfide isomerase/thioredoxin
LLVFFSLIMLTGVLETLMTNRLNLPAMRLIVLAAVAGVLAGGAAVYVRESTSGNQPGATVAGEADQCANKADAAKSVAASAVGDVAAMQAADPPQSLKFLSFKGADGKPTTLADHSGKTLLVNLWATWCAPCRAEMPSLDGLQATKGGPDFEVVAINVDTGDDAKPKKFLAETGVKTLGYFRDATMGVFNALKERALALGLPVTLLVDEEGCLLANMNGPANWSGPDAARLIDAARTAGS